MNTPVYHLTSTTVLLFSWQNSPLWPLPPPACWKKEIFLICRMFPSWKERKERFENNLPNSVCRLESSRLLMWISSHHQQLQLTHKHTIVTWAEPQNIYFTITACDGSELNTCNCYCGLVQLAVLNRAEGRAQTCFSHKQTGSKHALTGSTARSCTERLMTSHHPTCWCKRAGLHTYIIRMCTHTCTKPLTIVSRDTTVNQLQRINIVNTMHTSEPQLSNYSYKLHRGQVSKPVL